MSDISRLVTKKPKKIQLFLKKALSQLNKKLLRQLGWGSNDQIVSHVLAHVTVKHLRIKKLSIEKRCRS